MCKILKHKQPTTKKSFKWFGHGNSIQTDHSFQTHWLCQLDVRILLIPTWIMYML